MTFLSMTDIGTEDIPLAKVSCIYHLIQFQKDSNSTQALLNRKSKVNAINLAYAKKLGFQIQKIDADV